MAQANLITLRDPQAAASEAFRTLRTNLMFSSVDRPISTLLMTSTSQPDGKSEAIANLAVTFAQSGNRTILVDCDLRKPAQHSIWGVDNARGLTTMILEDGALATPPLVQTEVENLSLLPSGPIPHNPADILSNQRMAEIIGLLKARGSYVFFDAPPVLVASDAALLGSKLDGVLLVVRANHTRRDHVTQSKTTLERVHVRLLGAVLADAPRASGDYAYKV